MRRSSFGPWVFLLLASACGASRPAERSRSSSAGGRDVVVLLVVDQFAAWVAEERLATLPGTGGFARLVREGGAMRVLEHGHVVTDTAPGHASLMTGLPPREHGIGANERLAVDGTRVSIFRDEGTRLVTSEGPAPEVGSSLAMLRADTLADRLRARRPDAYVVSLSLKDRAALLGGGRRPDAVLYFDTAKDAFVTSTAFADALPSWARTHASTASVASRRSAPWTMLDPSFVRAHAGDTDDAVGEGNLAGFGTTFPHDFGTTRRPAHAFRASPRSDAALVDLALAALGSAPPVDAPILLVVSFSANDYVGHVFGPSSYESWDTQLRLDGELARLFEALDAQFGAEGWSAVLSADHGVSRMPEEAHTDETGCGERDAYERPCGGTVRLDADVITARVEAAARAELGEGPFVAGIAEPYLNFTERGRAPDVRPRLVAIAQRILLREPGIAEVYAMPPSTRCPDGTRDAFCVSYVPGLGDVYVGLAAGAFFDSMYVPGFGSGHGSPGAHDRRVPLLARFGARGRARGVTLPGGPGERVGPDAYFRIADLLLGGDGIARVPTSRRP